jgi:hypothetical protein
MMSTQSQSGGIIEQDRTLSDLLESYRHLQADPAIQEDRKQRATERMESVWASLAKLQDPDGFVNHLGEVVQREHQRRRDPRDDQERRGKPLCRCDRPRHVCEVKQGEVPSKIRTQNLEYIKKPGNRSLAREYVQTHSGDVIIREAMASYRNLRADIYGELSATLAMMRGREERESDVGATGGEDDSASASEDAASDHDAQDTPGVDRADAATDASDGGGGDE